MAAIAQSPTPEHSFQKEFITNHLIKDRSIDEIYQLIYSPYATKEEGDSASQSFLSKVYSRRNDKNILFNPISMSEEELTSKRYPCFKEYEYSYIHPVWKKIVLGPSAINVLDNYKLFFLSRKALIVEVTSTFSGFLFMDTFYSKMQYRYEQSVDCSSDLLLTVKFMIEFTKTNPFKAMALSSGYEENSQYVNEVVIKMMDDTLRHKELLSSKESESNSEEEERIDYILFANPYCSKLLVDYCLYEIYS